MVRPRSRRQAFFSVSMRESFNYYSAVHVASLSKLFLLTYIDRGLEDAKGGGSKGGAKGAKGIQALPAAHRPTPRPRGWRNSRSIPRGG